MGQVPYVWDITYKVNGKSFRKYNIDTWLMVIFTPCLKALSTCGSCWLFTLKSCASFEIIFLKIGRTAVMLLDFLYTVCISAPKLLKNVVIFVYKVNVNCVFSQNSYIYDYFYFYWLKLINFMLLMITKMSSTNFIKKQ